ncbi:complex I NDUFA9 subunit family protein [Dyella nitratireducens]|uniref:Complex I NDUFA9 subunit family protein n=1 Tax=Dyella nitratireducens TaxID=1849580 RepID=A0ABQ1FQP0_9GAMM|nr:complex I NDUFA9 subunit family protein [Dyella nitratireducens]GGA26319.1 complex I NDUFA9 subunit family protein [Dyella nitratireducens]GLQ43564.1 complex I NDUFA9 subunit family protein [Dyella nitratireducens]
MTPQRIVILGGTGFVGSYLVPRLAADGHRITLLSRNRELHRSLAVLPSIAIRSVDVYDDAVLRRHCEGTDAVINLIGILNNTGAHTFQRAHVEMARRLIAICQTTGVKRLHQMSSLKAGQGQSQYLKTRGEAETLVKVSSLDWTIYEPSVIFGPGDGLITRFASLLRKLPVLPLARASSRMAPTYVGDVAEAIARCVANDKRVSRRIFELYGPEVLTLGEIVHAIRDAAGLHTRIMPLPDSLGRLQAQVAGMLPGKPFSPDNFLSLGTDSVGSVDGYASLGIVPQSFTRLLSRVLQGMPRQRRLDLSRQTFRHHGV